MFADASDQQWLMASDASANHSHHGRAARPLCTRRPDGSWIDSDPRAVFFVVERWAAVSSSRSRITNLLAWKPSTGGPALADPVDTGLLPRTAGSDPLSIFVPQRVRTLSMERETPKER